MNQRASKDLIQALTALAVVGLIVMAIPRYPLTTVRPPPATEISPAGVIGLTGAGSTFIFPLMSRWSFEYQRLNPRVLINYQSVGSGAGIRQVLARTVDFGASDAPMSDEQYLAAGGILHIPVTIGAVVVIYNLPGVPAGLRLSGSILADVYLGRVASWNDPALMKLNRGIDLPGREILVVHRSDGSGTTYVFTEYLSAVSPDWAARVGRGTSVNWPVGLGAKGNEGVAAVVAQNPYSIGYVEFAYAKMQGLSYALIENASGRFVEPTIDSIASAASAIAGSLPRGDESWAKVSMVNPPGENSYPIASFAYLLVYREQTDKARGTALVGFIRWVIREGQRFSAPLFYVPLPAEVVALNELTLSLITHRGEPIV